MANPLTDAPRSCDDAAGKKVPVIDRNRCHAKGDCVTVCPYDLFAIRVLEPGERIGLSVMGRLALLAHRGRQAVVAAPEDCHACGLCVTACPEKAIRLVASTAA